MCAFSANNSVRLYIKANHARCIGKAIRKPHRNITAAATKVNSGLTGSECNKFRQALAFDIGAKAIEIRRGVQRSALRQAALGEFFGGFIKAVFRGGGARPFDDFSHAVFERYGRLKAQRVGDF